MTISASDAHQFPIYNARYRVIFPILDYSGGLVAGATSLDSELSQDTGTFGDATNEATQIATSSGMYYLDLVAGELDTKSTAIIVKSAEGKTTPIVLYPVRLPVIRTGTAQAGAASTITLDSGASAIDDYYNGCYVNITNNSPANAQGQARRIIDYVGSTKVATVEGTYGTNPSSASTFEVLATPEWVYRFGDVLAWNGTAVASPHTAGYPVVTVKDGTGTGEIDTTSGGVLVAALAANTITATSIATDAITAAKIAADAIGASELAADAVTEIQSGLATSANQTTILNRLGAFTGSGVNTILGFFQALMRSDATTPSDLGGTYDDATDSLQAIADSGGSSPTAADVADAVWDEARGDHTSTGSFGEFVPIDGADVWEHPESLMLYTVALDSATSTTAVLDTLDTLGDDFLNGHVIITSSDSGAKQARIVEDYDDTTKTVTLSEAWPETPESGWIAMFFPLAMSGGSGGLDAAGVRAAVGLASANLDTQLAAIDDAIDTEIAAILADTNELQTDWADGGRLDLILDARASQTSLDTLDDYVDTEVAAIKAKTDQLTFTTANQVDAGVIDKTGYALTTTEHTSIADALLKRDFAAVTGEAARSMLNALRFLRNKWSISGTTLTVTKEDDATTAWTATVTTNASADSVTGSDPN